MASNAKYPLQDAWNAWRASSTTASQAQLAQAIGANANKAVLSHGRVLTLGMDANGRDITVTATVSSYDDKGPVLVVD